MHNHKKLSIFAKIHRFLTLTLPCFFWVLLIFAFDSPYYAIATIICAVIHESGHVFMIWKCGKHSSAPLPRFFGLRIFISNGLSYKDEVVCALGGPLANFVVAVICTPLILLNRDAFSAFILINVLTGACNLLPIKGYDGYRILKALVNKSGKSRFILIADGLSFALISSTAFLSLYLIMKFGEGYWIFCVFFFSLVAEAKNGVNPKKTTIKEISRDFERKREKIHFFDTENRG